MMRWNNQPIPVSVALRIGWNLPIDVVGAGVYGGIVKRDASGKVEIGDEWPEDNRAPPAHNPVHDRGPFLDFSKFTEANRGYTHIAHLIMEGYASKLDALLQSVDIAERPRLANLVMTGGARPLHMCGMSRGGDASELIQVRQALVPEVTCAPHARYHPCSPSLPSLPGADWSRRRCERQGQLRDDSDGPTLL